jgi:hypothetical protein
MMGMKIKAVFLGGSVNPLQEAAFLLSLIVFLFA